MGSTVTSGQATTLPQAFSVRTLHDPSSSAWNMDTGEASRSLSCLPAWQTSEASVSYGTLSYNARLVANGSTQLEGVDVDETFSSVVKPDFVQSDYVYLNTIGPSVNGLTGPKILTGDRYCFLLMYVDDIVLTASSETLLQQIIRIFLSQRKYAVEIFERAHMVNYLVAYSDAIGWLPLQTEIDINVIGVFLGKQTSPLGPFTASIDASRSSAKPSIVVLPMLLFETWSSNCQATLSTSSAQSEYPGWANVVSESFSIWNLLLELHVLLNKVTFVYCDNVCENFVSGNPVQDQPTSTSLCS
ncbi:ribonuclease H-like domain-containing protein [Tanacetum coccineum]